MELNRPTFVTLSFGRQSQYRSPVNAILNYACAALESEIRIKAISEGCDPTIGIMHEGSDGSSKFVFDWSRNGRRLIVWCWISSSATFSIRRISPSAAMAWCGSIRNWRGMRRQWQRGCVRVVTLKGFNLGVFQGNFLGPW